MTSSDALATLLEVFFKMFWLTDTHNPAMHARTHG